MVFGRGASLNTYIFTQYLGKNCDVLTCPQYHCWANQEQGPMTSHTSFLSRNEPYISCQTDPAKKKNFSLTHFSQVFVTSPSMWILESGNKQRKGLIISFITHYNMWCSSNENTKKHKNKGWLPHAKLSRRIITCNVFHARVVGPEVSIPK